MVHSCLTLQWGRADEECSHILLRHRINHTIQIGKITELHSMCFCFTFSVIHNDSIPQVISVFKPSIHFLLCITTSQKSHYALDHGSYLRFACTLLSIAWWLCTFSWYVFIYFACDSWVCLPGSVQCQHH